jgi:flagellar biogenesis protein FliO
MKPDSIQMIVTCALFGALGALLQCRWLAFSENARKHTAAQRWLRILGGGIAAMLMWFVLALLIEKMPVAYARWVILLGPVLVLFVGLLGARRAAQMTPEQKASAGRIQMGVLVGGVAFVLALCLFMFWLT